MEYRATTFAKHLPCEMFLGVPKTICRRCELSPSAAHVYPLHQGQSLESLRLAFKFSFQPVDKPPMS